MKLTGTLQFNTTHPFWFCVTRTTGNPVYAHRASSFLRSFIGIPIQIIIFLSVVLAFAHTELGEPAVCKIDNLFTDGRKAVVDNKTGKFVIDKCSFPFAGKGKLLFRLL